ncbi:MAG: hypothetical protein KDK51_06130 [Deltaproteobacteria bacterium]|nr:hypothetical protein [Deltaproteobacteria bacterium]
MKNKFYHWALFVVESRIWIALGAVSVVVCSYHVASLVPSRRLLLSVFIGTWFLYFMQRYIPRIQINMENTKAKIGFVFFVLLSLALVWLLMQSAQWRIYAWLFVFSQPALFYAMRIKSKKGLFLGLRQIPYIKIIIVAAVWELLVLLPWVEQKRLVEMPLLYAAMMFFYLVAIIIPFDIRDMQTDSPHMKTVAQIVGKQQSTRLMFGFLLLAIICVGILAYQKTIQGITPYGFASILVLTLYAVFKKPASARTLYYEGILDGTLVLWILF